MKTVMVTGATAGFGKAIAEMFAANGYSLILTGRRGERLEELKSNLTVPVHTLVFDVRNRPEVMQAISDIPEKFRDIDILVNNAGLAVGLELSHEVDLDDWETMIDTNVKGLTYVTRAVLPRMVERKKGHVINIGSIAASWPYAGGNVYGATKAFVQQFSRNLRTDLHGTHVRVTNVEPGLAETEFSIVRFKGDTEKAKSVYENCEPLTSEDIAKTVEMVVNFPPHVNVNNIEVMPTCQSWGSLRTHRER